MKWLALTVSCDNVDDLGTICKGMIRRNRSCLDNLLLYAYSSNLRLTGLTLRLVVWFAQLLILEAYFNERAWAGR